MGQSSGKKEEREREEGVREGRREIVFHVRMFKLFFLRWWYISKVTVHVWVRQCTSHTLTSVPGSPS